LVTTKIMNSFFPISFVLIVINFLVSYRGFKDSTFYNKYSFRIDAIQYKDYKRLITSGFLHVNWMHLIFNMIALYFFSGSLEAYLGTFQFLLIYFTSLVGGNLLSLFIHRFDSGYSSVGASGAIMGVMFASIALFPGMQIGLFLLPFSFPAWLFGLAYVLISIYGIRSRSNNVGYDAHLGGGIAGMLLAILLHPASLVVNWFAILIIAIPAIAFIAFIVYKPEALLIDDFFKRKKYLTQEDKYNLSKKSKQQQLDDLLEKIHKKGMNSLSKKERDFLEKYS
jgi:membrane associated rhomboid family serine protease